MDQKENFKDMKTVQTQSELLEEYFAEMDQLLATYQDDPYVLQISEDDLHEMIDEWDARWKTFQQRWKQIMEKSDKVIGNAVVTKDERGIRHLVIRSGESGRELLDLKVSDDMPE